MRGSKDAYTDKQKRTAGHIEESYESRGMSRAEAERRAWATVNKDSGGGNLSGSGRDHRSKLETPRHGSHIASSNMSAAERSAAAKKGWETRRARVH